MSGGMNPPHQPTMNATTDADDVRTDAQKTEMIDGFAEYEAEYRETDDQREIVYEDDEHIIVADHRGHEINMWRDELDIDREDLRSTFRAIADDKMGDHDAHKVFSYSDPVVFDKLEN